jgi:hypothetical protein
MNANGCTSNLPYAFMAYTPVTLTLSLKTNARPLKRETMYYETKKYWTVNFFFGLRLQFTENNIKATNFRFPTLSS